MINKKIELTFIMPEMTPANRAAIKKQIAELPVNSRHFLLQKTKVHLFMKNTHNYLQQPDLLPHARLILLTLPHNTCH